jgi:hypothetical protein
MTTLDAFAEGASLSAAAANYWLDRLRQLSLVTLEEIVRRVPLDVMSKPAGDFAIAIMQANRKRLLGSE